MYRRFLSATLRVTLATVVLMAVALGSLAAYFIRQNFQGQADELAARTAVAVSFREASGLGVTPEWLDSIAPDDQLAVSFSNGRTVTAPGPSIGRQFVATRPDPLGGFTVTAGISQARSYALFGGAIGILLLTSAVSLAVAYRVAGREARRVNRPLGDLASHAETLGSGQHTRRAKPTGIDEIDRIARVLDDRSHRIGEVLDAERRTSREMSHQVRTPLTALSLRLEEIILTDDLEEAKSEAAVGVVQIERLTDVIDQLVKGRREGIQTEQEKVDLADLVSDQMVEWYPAFAARKRRIVLQAGRHIYAWASPGGQSQVLATLLENTLLHGRGDVIVRVRESGSSAVLEVVDSRGVMRLKEGQDPFERGVSASGTGLGLALAQTLVSADDGDIAMTSRRPPTFTVYLPLYRDQTQAKAKAKADQAAVDAQLGKWVGPA